MRRKSLIIGLACIAVLLCFLLIRFLVLPDKYLRQIYLVPENAVFILESADPVQSWKKFSASEGWQFMKGYPSFAEITEGAASLDTLLQENRRLFKLAGSRKLMISAHIIRPGDYDFLFLLDLGSISKMGSLRNQLDKLYGLLDYRVTTRQFEGTEIKELYDPKERKTLYLAFVRNHVVCSYTGLLVEAAIREASAPRLGRDLNFIDVEQEIPEGGLCKLYLNYRYFDDYIQLYTGDPVEAVRDLCNSLHYTGLNVELEENDLVLDGMSAYVDTLDAYLVALMRSGKQSRQAPEVLSQRTAFYLSLGVDDIDDFYGELEQVLKQDEASWKAFQEGLSLIERKLEIDVQEHLLSWMDGEIAFAQNEPGNLGRQQEFVVAVRAKNIRDASRKLDVVKEQVRKKTPLKFKEIRYHDYAINYLELGGFFRLFFGKMFDKLEKPYYTIIDEYVVFSNSTETLLNLIEDHRQKLTLSRLPEFREFDRQFSRSASVFAYLHSGKAFPLLKAFASPSSWESLQNHRKYVEAIRQWGLELVSDDANLFGTAIRLDFEKEIQPVEEPADPVDTLDELERFYVEKLQKNVYRQFYENGNIRTEVETAGGLRDGHYKEYYPDGKLKIYGRFKDNRRTGRWRYYDEEGKLLRRERYSEGVQLE